MKTLQALILLLCTTTAPLWAQFDLDRSEALAQYRQLVSERSLESSKCGFPAVATLRAESLKHPELRATLNTLAGRPRLPLSYVTPDGRFRFHYTTSGDSAVDRTSTNPAGVPDFIYEAGLAAQKAYGLLVGTLGMHPHADDRGADGPEFDFYVINMRNLGNLYGETRFDFPASANAGPAFIVIDNDFGRGYFSQGLEGLRVTVAHEYFHAVQLNYFFRDEDVFIFEMSSTWFEDFAYDEINDYYQYLASWFRNSASPLYSPASNHYYGSSIWLHYLTKRLATYAVIRELWEAIVNEPAITAMKTVVQSPPYNLPFGETMQEFYNWCFFTGSRADSVRYFTEGRYYPEIRYARIDTLKENLTLSGNLTPLSVYYYQFIRTAQDLQVSLQIDSDPDRWSITTISKDVNEDYVLTTDTGSGIINVESQAREDTVVVVVANVSSPPDPQRPKTLNYVLAVTLGQQRKLLSILENPRPNPFRPGRGALLQIPYRINQRAVVEAVIYRQDGKVLVHFKEGSRPIGRHVVKWDGKDASGQPAGSGVYFLRLLAGNLIETTKFVLVR